MSSKPKTSKPASRPHSVRAKSVDLGALQDNFSKARAAFAAASRAFTRAQEELDRSKAAFHEAHDALKAATHSVLA